MKAIVCSAYGPIEQLKLSEYPDPELQKGGLRIRVRAAGVSFVDGLFVQGLYQVKVPVPFVPGGEVAGEVLEVGEGVSGYEVGQRVVAMTGVGAFAEQVVTGPARVVPMPDGMDFAEASAFPMVCATAQYALVNRGGVREGETVLVLGAAGGTGMAALQVAKARGARVIAAASSAEKLALCRERGADEVVCYADEDLKARVKELTAGKGADLVFDPVGGELSELALRATAWDGRFLVIGFAAGDIPRVPLNLPLIKGCSVVGVDWGAFMRRDPKGAHAVLAEVVALFEGGKMPPLPVQRYPLANCAEALADLAGRRVMGKAVLDVD